MGIRLFRSFSVSLILSLSSLYFVLVLLLPDRSPRSFFLSMLPCLIFNFVFLSGVQSTCTANPEQVFPSPLSVSRSTWPPIHLHHLVLPVQTALFNFWFDLFLQTGLQTIEMTSPAALPLPFFHGCLAQSQCMIHLQYASFSPSSIYHLLSHLLCPGVHSC